MAALVRGDGCRMKKLFAIILTLCLLLGVLPEALAYDYTSATTCGDGTPHSWGAWETIDKPGCENDGCRQRQCTKCQYYQVEELPKLGHDYKEKVEIQPTCEDWGVVRYTCSRCGDTYQDEIEPLGHNWQKKTTREPTCTENGQADNVCSRCGEKQAGTIILLPPLGHRWGQWIIGTPSTCVEYGTRYHVCERCGEKEWERNYADGLGDHDWGEWQVVQPATPMAPGIEERVCKVDSSHRETRDIPPVAVEIDVFLDNNEKWLPEKYVIGSKIEMDMYTYNYSNVPITLIETEITEHPIGDLIDPWPEIDGTVIQPGESFHWVLTIYINGADGMVGEAIRHIYQTYSYSDGVPAPVTGQTNVIELHYPIEEEGPQYILKGAAFTYSGVDFNDSMSSYGPALDGKGSAVYTWEGGNSPDGKYYQSAGMFYRDSGNNEKLETPPAPGETYYFDRMVVSYADYGHEIDYTQIDPALVSCTIPGFSVTFLKAVPESNENIDWVTLYFAATYEGVNPSISLEIKQITPEKESYHPTDRVDLEAVLTNTGNVPLKNPEYFFANNETWHFVKQNPVTLAPGESVSFTGLFFIFDESDLAKGYGKVELIGQAWQETAIDSDINIEQFGGNDLAVQSNVAEITWPVTPAEPSLQLEIIQVTPEQANYHPKDKVFIDVVLTNTGNVTLKAPAYFLIEEDGAILFQHDDSALIAPGESYTFTGHHYIFDEEDLAKGGAETMLVGQAWMYSLLDDVNNNQLGGSERAVQSNADEISWPVTAQELLLEVAQISPVKPYYELNDEIQLQINLVNTGSTPLGGPGYFFDWAYDGTRWYSYDDTVIEPGGDFAVFYETVQVWEEDVEMGYMGLTFNGQAWKEGSPNIEKTVMSDAEGAVHSNTVVMTWPTAPSEETGSLLLEVSWEPDVGIGKKAGDHIPERFKLTNTSDVLIAVPARIGDSYVDVVQPNWYIELAAGTFTVLKPGWDMEWTLLDEVYVEDVKAGRVKWSIGYVGYILDDNEESTGVKVVSNSVDIDIPLTDETAAGKPALELITYNAPLKSSYPYAELYGECDVVRIDYVLNNVGDVPLYVEQLEEKWGDGYDLKLPIQKTLYPGESFSDYTNVWLVTNVLTPNTEGPDTAGMVDVEYYAYGRDADDTDTILCETAHCPYSFKMDLPGPVGWELPSESDLWVYKYEKYGSTLPEGYQKGEQIVYVIEIWNAGEVDVDGAVLIDSMLGVNETLPNIPVGDWIVREYTYTVTEEDVATGGIYNEAYVEWTDPDSEELKSDLEWCLVYTTAETSLLLSKRIEGDPANGEYYAEGEEIDFRVKIKNNTDMPVGETYIDDPLLFSGDPLATYASLAPGEEHEVPLKHKVTEGEAAYGIVTNIAYSEYVDYKGDWHFITSNPVDAYTGAKKPNDTTIEEPPIPPYKPVFGVVSDISISKAQDNDPINDSYYAEGETIRYAITVKNEGEVPVDVEVYDSLAPGSSLIDTITGLAPNASKTVYYEYKVTKADVDATCVVNHALAKWHPQGVWAETIYKSNEVNSPTSEKQPNPDDTLKLPGTGDSCWREVTKVSEYGIDYTLHLCAEHAAIEAATEVKKDKGVTCDWQKAVTMWREAVDAEYEKYLEAAEGTARVIVINERLTYYLWLGSYEKQLNLLYPNDPDAVAQKIAESLMDRCADLCCGEHTATNARKDSLTGARVTEGLEPYANCDRIVTYRNGNEIRYTMVFDAKHAAAEKNALTLVREAEGGAAVANAWARAQQLWQIALDKEVNALYKAAGKEDRQVIAMTRRFLDQMVTARAALLDLVYGDSTVVSEQIERLYKEYAIVLCGK